MAQRGWIETDSLERREGSKQERLKDENEKHHQAELKETKSILFLQCISFSYCNKCANVRR